MLDPNLSPELEEYIIEHSSEEDEVLYQLRRHSHLKVCNPQMISGPVQGKFLELLVKLLNPKRVLEIGTFTGYSTICMAKGLNESAHLHTIEVNDEIINISKDYFEKAKLAHLITSHLGDALDIIPTIHEMFDFVLVDGDKREYTAYLKCVLPKVNIGGLIIADNVLWSGKVVDPKATDMHTKAIIDFNKYVKNNQSLEKVMLPIRDGITLIRKNA
jgi:predicted O-methyltransferase YrrM